MRFALHRAWSAAVTAAGWTPNVDVFQSDYNLVVRVEIAGLAESDFSIVHQSGNIVVEGVRKDPMPKIRYEIMEIPFGPFRVAVELSNPSAVDLDRLTASYENGFLLISCPLRKYVCEPATTIAQGGNGHG